MLLLKMRSGIFSYIFLGFLLLGGLGLVLMDWTGSYSGVQGSSNVAVVAGEPISGGEFDRMAKRILRSQQIAPDVAYQTGMIDQILEVTIMDHLLKQAAVDYGLLVDDQHVIKQINTMLNSMAGKGQDKKQVLDRLLQAQNMTERELIENLRASVSTGILREVVAQNYYVPAVVASDLYKYSTEQRNAEAATFSQDNAADIKAPSDAQLEAYFKDVQDRFIAPESRSFTVAVLTPETLVKAGEGATDADVKAYYDDNQDSFRVDERRVIEQVALESEEKIAAVLKAAKGGKKLQDALKSVTKDTKGYVAETGFEKNGLPGDLSSAVFAAKEGDYLGPIKSPLGWHAIQVKKIQPAQVEPFDRVKDSIRKDLEQNARGDAIYEAVNEIDDRIASGEQLEDIAKDAKMTLITLKDVRMSQPNFPELKPFEADEGRILEVAFKQQGNETSALSEMSSGKMFAVRIDKTSPKRQKDLSEVKDEVRDLWMREQKAKANAAFIQKALEQLNAQKTTLADIAKEKGVKVQTFTGLTRESKSPAGLSDGNLRMLMNGEAGKYMVMPADGGITIARVTKVTGGDKSAPKDKISSLQDKAGSDVSQENLLIFINELQSRYKTEKNDALLKRMYSPPEEGK